MARLFVPLKTLKLFKTGTCPKSTAHIDSKIPVDDLIAVSDFGTIPKEHRITKEDPITKSTTKYIPNYSKLSYRCLAIFPYNPVVFVCKGIHAATGKSIRDTQFDIFGVRTVPPVQKGAGEASIDLSATGTCGYFSNFGSTLVQLGNKQRIARTTTENPKYKGSKYKVPDKYLVDDGYALSFGKLLRDCVELLAYDPVAYHFTVDGERRYVLQTRPNADAPPPYSKDKLTSKAVDSLKSVIASGAAFLTKGVDQLHDGFKVNKDVLRRLGELNEKWFSQDPVSPPKTQEKKETRTKEQRERDDYVRRYH